MDLKGPGTLQRFGGEVAGRIASAACALTVLVLTIATVAMKKDGEPLLESILIVVSCMPILSSSIEKANTCSLFLGSFGTRLISTRFGEVGQSTDLQ